MTPHQQRIQKAEEARRDEALALGLQVPEAPPQETWMQKAMREAEEQKARKEQARLAHDERQLANKPIGGTVRASPRSATGARACWPARSAVVRSSGSSGAPSQGRGLDQRTGDRGPFVGRAGSAEVARAVHHLQD